MGIITTTTVHVFLLGCAALGCLGLGAVGCSSMESSSESGDSNPGRDDGAGNEIRAGFDDRLVTSLEGEIAFWEAVHPTPISKQVIPSGDHLAVPEEKRALVLYALGFSRPVKVEARKVDDCVAALFVRDSKPNESNLFKIGCTKENTLNHLYWFDRDDEGKRKHREDSTDGLYVIGSLHALYRILRDQPLHMVDLLTPVSSAKVHGARVDLEKTARAIGSTDIRDETVIELGKSSACAVGLDVDFFAEADVGVHVEAPIAKVRVCDDFASANVLMPSGETIGRLPKIADPSALEELRETSLTTSP